MYLYDFLSKLSKDIEIINIEYFDGEPTTYYKFKDMIKLYNNIYNIKCVLATNFSADVNLYDEILSLTNNKIARLNLSYHQNHADINEFKSN